MTPVPSPTRRFLACHLPFLPAERAILAGCVPRDALFALVETVRGAVRLVAASPSAADLVGLTLSDARARVPDLAVVPHDHSADAALLAWLADGGERYSPRVAADPPAGFVIDITGCVAEFATEDALAADLAAHLAGHGLTARLALGDTPRAAAALAEYGGAVATLPLAALRLDADTCHGLRRAGLATVGALAKRPAAVLAARFGAALTDALAKLLGTVDDPLTPRRSPPAIVVDHRFADPVATTAAVLATLDRLMVAASGQLAARGAGGRRFEVGLFRSDGHVARLAVDTAAPTRDPAVIARLLRERIDALADPLDPGFGFDLVRFAVAVTEPLGSAQLALDGGAVGDAAVAALVDRLATRLGANRVRRLARGDSHLPEQAAFDLPFAATPDGAWPAPDPGEPPLRPLQLFTPPQPIEVMAEVPDGPPRWFRWRRVRHDVARVEGPERIAAQWWTRRDGAGATRDYYRVEDAGGRRFWVFRHGLYGVETATPAWFIHGVFA